ncbi:MAG TPA: PLP-dependent transferase [Opitutaceae bacterium]|jgi:cystathionine gamma-synthase
MPAFSQIPLGTPLAASPHAVSCSLPTMADIRGYEEKDPAVTARLQTGYPRFVVHPFARRLAETLAARAGLGGRTLWLASSGRMAGSLLGHLRATPAGRGAEPFSDGGIHGASHPLSAEAFLAAKLFLQNTGGFLPSRQAEDRLAALGGPPAGPENLFQGDAAGEVLRHLGPLFAGASAADLTITNSGMNAVYAAFRAVNDVQRPRGRTAWVQLGWLYLDTIAILRRFAPGASDYIHVKDVMDADALAGLFRERGSSIAGVVAEVPTNPLVQTPGVAALAGLCRMHGARLILDPSLSSAYSVDCLPHADVAVTSLTKYTASEGDVMAGMVAVNPAGPDAGALRGLVRDHAEASYSRDLARLAWQVGETSRVLSAVEASTPQVATFLEAHPAVRSVHWALSPPSRANYLALARGPGSTGGIISFALRGDLAQFYDRVRLPKGPSFGMKRTLICPVMYLAHYDLVSTEVGRAELRGNGLDPCLLRLCVGTEPAAEIIGALAEALGG